jgi:hypothetical protein
MLGYPLDARSTSAIAKSISGFAMLRHVDESEVMSRIVIKVCMNAESQVPPSVAERSSGPLLDGPNLHPLCYGR